MRIQSIILSGLLLFLLSASLSAKEVNDNLTLIVTERFRIVSWNETVTLNDAAQGERLFTRHRTTIGGAWRPRQAIEFGLAFAHEYRYYMIPREIETNAHEIFFDKLYVKFTNPYGYPLTLTIGRQNIILGEGFVVMDGGPLDGSRSIYFNAVRADFLLRPDQTLTLFAVNQKETDQLLPVINDQDQPMVDQPEKALGVYYSGDIDKATLDGYYIYKQEDSNGVVHQTSHIHTLGARLDMPLTGDVSFTSEWAKQFGDRGIQNRAAVGGYAYLTYRPQFAESRPYVPVSITGGVIYLSGGNEGSRKWNDWDPLFSRWPKWSDSYIYTQIRENGVAYWTNLSSFYGKAKWSPDRNVSVQFDYHHLMAPANPGSGLSFPGGIGETRGELLIGKLSYEINSRLTGNVAWERFWPGNYYRSTADPYVWLRTELLFKW